MTPISAPNPKTILLGESPAIREVQARIAQTAMIDVPVLITGESGTGKGVAAKLLHEMGIRRSGPFVKKNCPAIPGPLFESELFGSEPGAFTGANRARAGAFEQAHRGTFFLDEVGELPLPLQSKLLQVLQDFKVTRLGSLESRRIDVGLICATNRDLMLDIEQGHFRADLFYRIGVVQIVMPPLRQRREDIPILIAHALQLYSDAYSRDVAPLSKSLMKILESYHWPGNIRELENLMKRYVVFGTESVVLSALGSADRTTGFLLDSAVDIHTPLRIQTKRAMKTMERRIIMNVLQANRWNRKKTARSLDISYRALLYKIKDSKIPAIRRTPPQKEPAKDSHEKT